jgi:G:T-mismatch repair DNA endonuclease (very short patch repair protein)
MIFSPYILPIRHFLFWFMIPRSSAYVFMWSPITMEQRYQRTQEKIQYIQDNGYPVKQMWECDWERLKKIQP